MSEKLRWGILGTGAISHKFAEDLKFAAGAELVAVGSRTSEKAEKFGEEFGIPHRHGSYQDLAADDEVDAVYVATPHPFHKENSILCLEAHKAVLCEKPLTVNAAQADQIVRTARKNKLFCMEAMWTRFLPGLQKLRELLAADAIGEVRMVMANFGFRAGWNPEGRLLNLQLAGGGLLDAGVYPVSLASMIFGAPRKIAALGHIGQTGVDEQAAIVFSYEQGQLASLSCGVRTSMPSEAWILGTDGSIRLHSYWLRCSEITLNRSGGKPEHFELPVTGGGYNYEAEEVARCIAAGKTESDIMPLDESISIMRTMDEIRSQWGLKYPMD